MKSNRLMIGALALTSTVSTPVFAGRDFGEYRDFLLQAHSRLLFGINGALGTSSTESVDIFTAESDPRSLVTLAQSLQAKVVSAETTLGPNIDMMVLWPQSHPTHLIACDEQGTSQPGVQRVRLSDGFVETVLTGMSSCDPVRATPWGTVIVGEEAGNGSLLEIIDPLNTTGVVYDRVSGALSGSDAGNVAVRPALGHLSFEGIAIYPNGVLYYGDENRPSNGTAGGAYFKFIPSTPWVAGPPINDLSKSPLIAGNVYGLRLGLRSGASDYGQGTNTGLGTWVQVVNSNNADLRAAAGNLKLTGYYRPEDFDIDGHSLARGDVRFCANNTGNEGDDKNWGETICVTDGSLTEATANTAVPEVQPFVAGTREFAMMDNIAYQPGRGNWIIHEDGDAPGFAVNPHNNDLWACLEDGRDDDSLSDGCIRIATLNDLNAEWTGGFFDSTGTRFYVSVQHNVTGHGVILEISGWK
ncbi:MAG: alkaline phosphatase PhoX [Methylococcales bacterium]